MDILLFGSSRPTLCVTAGISGQSKTGVQNESKRLTRTALPEEMYKDGRVME